MRIQKTNTKKKYNYNNLTQKMPFLVVKKAHTTQKKKKWKIEVDRSVDSIYQKAKKVEKHLRMRAFRDNPRQFNQIENKLATT